MNTINKYLLSVIIEEKVINSFNIVDNYFDEQQKILVVAVEY